MSTSLDSANQNDESACNAPAIELDWDSAENIVSVNPQNAARFRLQKDRAIAILQLADGAGYQIQFLINRVTQWVHSHARDVDVAYVTLRDSGFMVLIVSRDIPCNDDLEDSVSDLDWDVANDSDLEGIRMNAIVLPPVSKEALASFVDRRFLMVIRNV